MYNIIINHRYQSYNFIRQMTLLLNDASMTLDKVDHLGTNNRKGVLTILSFISI